MELISGKLLSTAQFVSVVSAVKAVKLVLAILALLSLHFQRNSDSRNAKVMSSNKYNETTIRKKPRLEHSSSFPPIFWLLSFVFAQICLYFLGSVLEDCVFCCLYRGIS